MLWGTRLQHAFPSVLGIITTGDSKGNSKGNRQGPLARVMGKGDSDGKEEWASAMGKGNGLGLQERATGKGNV